MGKYKQNVPVRVPTSIYVLGIAAVVVVAGLATIYFVSGGSGSQGTPSTQGQIMNPPNSMFPDYVMAGSDRVQTAYQFAVDRPDVLMWMSCYCGCGSHSGHKSAKNCFLQEGSTSANPRFDEHGSMCDMCVGIAVDTKALLEQGKSLRDIRTFIDGKYGVDAGPGTNTPLPPA